MAVAVTATSTAPARAQLTAPWRARGLCVGRAALFASPAGSDGEQAALATCAACPVLLVCLFEALRTPEPDDNGGVLAGLTETERATSRRHFVRKRCARCRRVKRGTEFSPDNRARTGCGAYCHPCDAARAREFLAARRASIRTYETQGDA